MKKLLLVLVLAATGLVTYAQTNSGALDAKHGFRDLAFGDTIIKIKGLQFIANQGLLKMYKRPSDKMLIGGAPVSSITYKFYNNKLAQVELRTQTLTGSSGVISALKSMYGFPTILPKAGAYWFLWEEQLTRMTFEQDKKTQKAIVLIEDKALLNQALYARQQQENRIAKKAASDL